MKPQTRKEYEISLKHYRDWVNVLTTAKEESHKEGREEGINIGMEKGEYKKALEIATNLKKTGVDIETIVSVTHLSKKEILTIE